MTGQRREDGFTIVEVLIAAFILLIGAGATLKALSATAHNAQRGKETAVAQDIAQQEMERIRALSYSQIALTSLPASSPDSANPDYRVSGGSFNLNKKGAASYAGLVVNGGSLYGGGSIDCSTTPASPCLSPGSVLSPSTSIGSVKIQIYRFVVWQNDPQCSDAVCPGSQDFKRVIVAARIVQSGNTPYDRGYVEVQSDFIDPSKTTATIPTGGTGGIVTAQQFWLSDTPCSTSATTPRSTIAGDHLLHNTLGTCSSGLQSGTTLGSPDLLMTAPPPDPAPDDSSNPSVYDYASDYEPSPSTDSGVQISREDASGCTYAQAGGTANPESKIHRWVTDKMTTSFSLSGKVTIEFYTQAINEVTHTGKLCIYLFKRSETGGQNPVATDTAYTDGTSSYFTYSNSSWPKTNWTKVRYTFTPKTGTGGGSSPVAIPVGQRLGLAISVERANTSASAIQILYDHPDYPSRLEVETTTPLDAG